jgi:hypothetical protein
VRIRLALVLALALLTAVPAEAARDRFVRDSPRSAVATCLRATGAPGVVGLLGPLERRMSPYDLLRVTADGVSVAGTARLGILDECPAVAADPSGHAVVAGAVRGRRFRGVIRAALAEPGGGFGAPVEIARVRSSLTPLAAAVSPRGDAVVAWTVVRETPGRRGMDALTRVVAAARTAGGSFGRPQFLTPWRRGSFVVPGRVSVGIDASGTATVVWAQAIPDRGNIPHLSTVEVAAAPPGEPFGAAQVLTRSVQDTERVALSVAPDGRALLAHDGQETIQVFERVPGAPAFTRSRRMRSRRGGWEEPAVAVAPDGSAVVAWRGDDEAGSEDVFVASRRGTGPWASPAAVQRSGADRSSLIVEFFSISFGGGRPSPPLDSDNMGVRAVLAPDGRYLLGWGVERRLPFGDRPLAVRVVPGEAGAGASRPEAAGCACRSVNGVVPLLAGGELLFAYTDNASRVVAVELEIPRGSGRLHVAGPGPPGLAPAAPRVRVRPPRPVTLGYGQRLRVRVGCDRACDLRAYVVGGRGRARGMAIATLRGPGTTRLAIVPGSSRHLAPPAGRTARIVVHGYAPNGRRFASRSVPVELRRKPLRPLPRLLDVRAVRRGGGVDVTWQTARPATRIRFEIVGQLSRRGDDPFLEESVLGRGRRRFRVRLAGTPDSVSVSVIRNRPPFDRETVVVDVSG